MGNEVSTQRVTFGSRPPLPPYKQVQQEASLNKDTLSTNKREREDSEEDHSSQNVSKRRKLHQDENGSHNILTSKSLIVILRCDSLSSLQSVSQQKNPMRTKKDSGSSREENNPRAVLKGLVKQELEYINREKQNRRRLRRQREKAMASNPGRDPIGTPSSADLQTNISTDFSTVSERTASAANKDVKIKESPEIRMKFRFKTSPNKSASTSSAAAENKDQLIVKLKLPKELMDI
ncbi:uncharacterized protein Bfra_004071 [Botrytis fragariae]|uniref:Uncharacterized protein n=1 Tax=Botrytis fragariae TaxID=1964551 RepID=A0A8H6EJ16_9HELO|nr:uncharacterized protein Bfra_004071 [Botrytis fragariae]KAF5874064.1 hypothetical protein Bfra_004071 [Botrytis fragariae]